MLRMVAMLWLPPTDQLSPRFSMATPGAVAAPSPLPAVIESPNAAMTRMSLGRSAWTLVAAGCCSTFKAMCCSDTVSYTCNTSAMMVCSFLFFICYCVSIT